MDRIISKIAESPSLTLMAILADQQMAIDAIRSSEPWTLALSCQSCTQVYYLITRKGVCDASSTEDRIDIIKHVLDGAVASIKFSQKEELTINQGCKCLELKQKAKAEKLKQMNAQLSLYL